MNDNRYSTLILKSSGIPRQNFLLFWGLGCCALILIFLNIYFIFAAVSVSNSLAIARKEFFAREYAYQETVRAYQSLLAGIENEYFSGGLFSRLDNPEFVLRVPSLVLR